MENISEDYKLTIMKELSIEEKARRYDEALEKIHRFIHGYSRREISKEELEDIFPELKENEDEKVRKSLLAYIKGESKYLDTKKWITYLEKQGEHSNFLSKIQIGDRVTRNENGVLVNLSQLNRVANKDEKQSGRFVRWEKNTADNKPALNHSVLMKNIHGVAEGEWNGEEWIQYRWSCKVKDSDVLYWMDLPEFEKQGGQKPVEKHSCECIHVGCHVNNCRRWCHSYKKEIPYTECNTNCDRYSEQKPVEWSTNDEFVIKILNTVCDEYLRISTYKGTEFRHEVIDAKTWLKSLKDRTQPQPRQEWSEEDECLFQIIIDILDKEEHKGHLSHTDLIACVKKLKSLRPQSHWKPSDEQIKGIECAIKTLQHQLNVGDTRLNSLYDDLKKLRKE